MYLSLGSRYLKKLLSNINLSQIYNFSIQFILMKTLITILFTFSIFQVAYSQFAFNNVPFKLKNPPSTGYKIIQYKTDEISKIEEVNQKGEIIFQYKQGEIPPYFNWTEPHRFIYAFKYNKNGKLLKRYALNSNAGHHIYEYHYNEELRTKTRYEKTFPRDKSLMNTNAYSNIERINSYKQLLESSEVTEMMAAPSVFIDKTYLNEVQLPIKIQSYSKMYKDSVCSIIEYNTEGKEISKKNTLSTGEIKRENRYSYTNENTKTTTINNYRNGQPTSSYQFATVTDSTKETETTYSISKKVLKIRHYQYKDGYLIRVLVYKTKYKKKLIVPITKKCTRLAQMEYTYNQNGLLEREVMNNYETREKVDKTYTYKIEHSK